VKVFLIVWVKFGTFEGVYSGLVKVFLIVWVRFGTFEGVYNCVC